MQQVQQVEKIASTTIMNIECRKASKYIKTEKEMPIPSINPHLQQEYSRCCSARKTTMHHNSANFAFFLMISDKEEIKKTLITIHKELIISVYFFVGVAGFEPTTPCSQSRCANRTALHPATFLIGFLFKSDAKVGRFFKIAIPFAIFLLIIL